MLTQTIEGETHGGMRHESAGRLLDLVRDGHAIRVVTSVKHGKHDDQLEVDQKPAGYFVAH